MFTETGTDIARAAEWLRAGEVCAVPTETVYGLAANALDPVAVTKIFEAKQRPSFDPLIVHIGHPEDFQHFGRDIPPYALELARRFWPGPLTLVVNKSPEIPDVVTSGLGTVGIRMPAHPVTQDLLRMLDFPLAAPSANPFGYISPTTAAHVEAQLGGVIPYILDGGPCAVGVESTILLCTGEQPVLLRPGGISLESLQKVVGAIGTAPVSDRPDAPGMLLSHYAPRKPLVLGDLAALVEAHRGQRVGIISLLPGPWPEPCIALSSEGDLGEAARHLFAAMRTLDAADIDVILAEYMPQKGLGAAINDRLTKASHKG